MRISLLIYGFTCTLFASSKQQNVNYPIDIVYLWVDGNDSAWQEIKEYYWQAQARKFDSCTPNRFADHEELRYSLRSIFTYAPFFNHIYIVTMNQRPVWLNDDPRITIIDHSEIFKNPDDLPTFNSHALESNLHRIPGLSEHFIYFNDDVFLGAPVKQEDFFTPEGKVRVLFEQSLSPSGEPLLGETLYRRAWRNTNNFLDTHYTPEPRYRLAHAPFALRKSFIEMAEKSFSHIFESNSRHRFRCAQDYNMTNGLLQYFWYYHDLIATSSLTNRMVSMRDDTRYEKTERALKKVLKQKLHTFCLQDVMPDESVRTQELLHHFLITYYPTPAPWEK